jgi:hypothetical protein
MPYDSIVGLGNNHPQILGGTHLGTPLLKPSGTYRPGDCDVFCTAKAPGFCTAVLGPQPLPELRYYLADVRIKPGLVALHADWRTTCVAPAIDALGRIDLHAITPEMLRALPIPMRRTLYSALSATRQRVNWADATGRRHHRRPVLGLQAGRRWRINGATALVLRMAQVRDPRAFREALYDGLLLSTEELQGASGTKHFTAEDVTYVCRRVIDDVLACSDPSTIGQMLEAAASLIRHYLQGVSAGRSATLEQGMQQVCRLMLGNMAQDADHLGIGIGLLLSGGFKYTGDLNGADAYRRWIVASMANVIWSTQNFVPIAPVSGVIASTVVVGAVLWDRSHPPRNYDDVIKQCAAKIKLATLQGCMPLANEQLARFTLWVETVCNLNGY